MENVSEVPTYNISGVEVFSAGKWNNDNYSISDLHEMVTAFNSLKGGFKPYLKLGHDDHQKLAKSSGLPSIGWVENLYVRGEKLLADFNYIPKKIFQLIKSKAYRKVSCEIYWNLEVNGSKYPRVLSAIALLGAETPGVMNLTDILGNYTLLQNKEARVFEAMGNQDNFKSYEFNLETQMEEDKMSEELDKVQKELDEQKKSYASIEAEKTELQKQIEAQKDELNKFREEAEKARIAEKNAKIAQFVTELEAKKLASPSMKDHLTELLSDKKEYTIKEKQMTREDILTEILTLSQEMSKVNFDESSRADFAKKGDKEKELSEEIEKYQKDNKCDYAKAYKEVMRGKKEEKLEE